MKKQAPKLFIVFVLLAVVLTVQVQAAAANTVFTLLNPPPGGVLELAVGESYTFDVLVESDMPFLSAMALPDQYYPGRGVFFAGSDIAHNASSARLYLTVTGKNSTAGLPGGFAPISVVAAARYKGGQTDVSQFDFQVFVP